MAGFLVFASPAKPAFSQGYPPTDQEQLFLERLNDARSDPPAYGRAIGLDLSNVAPAPPLAFNSLLIQAAKLHSEDMNRRNFLEHRNPDGEDAGQRMHRAGFDWQTWGESIAGGYGYSTVEAALRGLIIDNGVPGEGHRRHLLAIDEFYRSQNQVGIGIVQNGSGEWRNYYTIDTAKGPDVRLFITGVVFDDRNGNGAWEPGEGLGGVTITVSGVGSTQTWSTGGYSFQVNPGIYTITASGGGLSSPLITIITVSSQNYRLNFNPRNFTGFSMPVSPSTAIGGRNRPTNFVWGLDDQVYAQKFDENGNPVGGYFLVAPGRVKSFAVGNVASGNLELFVIGLNDQIFAVKFDGNDNPTGSYFLVRENRVKSITIGQDANDCQLLFAMGMNDNVFALKFDAAGNPVRDFYLVAVGAVLSVQPTSLADGTPMVFVTGLNNQVFATKLSRAGDPTGPYFRVAPDEVKDFSVGNDASGNPLLFAIGRDDQVWVHRFDHHGNPVGGFTLAAEGRVKSFAVSNLPSGAPELYVIGLDYNLWQLSLDSNGNAQGGYRFTRWGMVKTLSPVQDADGNTIMFAAGGDNRVYEQKFEGDNSTGDWVLVEPNEVK